MYPRLCIQNFLNSFGDGDTARHELRSKHGVEVSEEIIVFNNGVAETVYLYNCTPSKWRTIGGLRSEANGLILNSANDIVSCSFKKFFNDGDPRASSILDGELFAERLLDGELIVVYFYRNEFFIQTKTSAMALNYIPGTGITYYRAVTELLKNRYPVNPFTPFLGHEEFSGRYCWAFEYIRPGLGQKEDLVLLSAFRKDTAGMEVQPKYLDNFASSYGLKRPERFERLRSEEAAYELLEDCCGPLDKGLVLFDQAFERKKLINPAYKSLKKIITDGPNARPKHFAEIVLTGEAEVVAAHFDKYANLLLLMDEVLQEIVEDLSDMWAFHSDCKCRKEFAAAVKHHDLACILFDAWRGKVKDFEDVCQRISPYYLVEATKKRHAETYRRVLEEALTTEDIEEDKETNA